LCGLPDTYLILFLSIFFHYYLPPLLLLLFSMFYLSSGSRRRNRKEKKKKNESQRLLNLFCRFLRDRRGVHFLVIFPLRSIVHSANNNTKKKRGPEIVTGKGVEQTGTARGECLWFNPQISTRNFLIVR
jgi:hypothetical protein